MAVDQIYVRRVSGEFLEDTTLSSVAGFLAESGTIVWIDAENPSPEETDRLVEGLGLDALAAWELKRHHHRARIEQLESCLLVIFYAVLNGELQEIKLLVGKEFLLTTHVQPLPVIAETVTRWRQNVGRIDAGVAVLVYSLLDAIVDGYFPLVDDLAEDLEELDAAIFEKGGSNEALQQVFRLKRQLIGLRRALTPERDVLNALVRRDSPIFGLETLGFFQDVYDHVLRILESVDLYRDQLAASLDAYLSVVSNRLNVTMKKMTALATILMSVTLIASIYGMNFQRMPELEWPLGYAWALGVMLGVGGGLALTFRRIDWL